jgi:hypothetical protein
MSELPISSRELIRFTPAHYVPNGATEVPGAGTLPLRAAAPEVTPVYLVKPATPLEKARWRRAVAAEGARFVSPPEVRREVRRALFQVQPNDAAEWLALLDRADEGDEVSAEDARLLDVLLTATMRASANVAELVAAQHYWYEVAPVIAAQQFCRGWVVGPRQADGAQLPPRDAALDEAALALLPEADLTEIGWKAIALMRPSEEQEKNSASPSQSG